MNSLDSPDDKSHKWKSILLLAAYILLQTTWGILQNLIGLGIFLRHIRSKHFFYHGAVATVWASGKFSLGMGMFIFMRTPREGEEFTELPTGGDFARVLVHEYGHTIQSVILGPLYLPVISIPSGLWCNLPQAVAYRKKHKVSYYAFYPEKWADHLGGKAIKQNSFFKRL